MTFDITGDVLELQKHKNKEYRPRNRSRIDMIVIHHSGSDVDTIKSIASWHVDGKDWPGIGYHFVIDRSGNVHRTNSIETTSFHCSGYNARSVGVCLLGNFDNKEVPQVQLDSLVKVIKGVKRYVHGAVVRLHRQIGNTDCPGKHLTNSLIAANMKKETLQDTSTQNVESTNGGEEE